LSTDNNNTLVCGTARHGLVRLWDMRSPQPVQMYYTKHAHRGQSSPVYSVAFDQANLYVALDQCLNLMSFAGLNNQENSRKKVTVIGRGGTRSKCFKTTIANKLLKAK
jgi:WD40 repeat protein